MINRSLLFLLGCLLAPFSFSNGLPKLAIIIDDVGYNFKRETPLTHTEFPLTLAILPDFNHSKKLAELSKANGVEVMLHLAMESSTGFSTGQIGLTKNMSQVQKSAALELALSEVPHAVGVSNHMGSLLTEDRETMDWLMSELKARNLFFIDSLTAPDSVAALAAKQAGVKWNERNVFLDNERNAEYLEQQFQQALRYARRHGSAILIGHPYPETLAFLKHRLPIALDFEQIQLVPVSRILNQLPMATARHPN